MSHPDRIYHYTSIDSLALILRTRKLRLSRLDGVDDATEAPQTGDIAFSKYFFVSCWTADSSESIPQWHMYTRNMSGVRIELPAYPFIRKRLRPPETWKEVQSEGEIYSPVDFSEMFGSSYMITPMVSNRDFFAGPVEYTNDVQSRYTNAV